VTTPATIAQEKTQEVHVHALTRVRNTRKFRPLRWILLLAAAVIVANVAGSWLVQHTGFRRILNARLASAFGRPVEVGHYSFSLWDGPALVAAPIEVAEDSRFGHEYFLRADSISLRLRWLSLLAGRVELGTLSLSRPSLNLVRAADGRWNIEEWLPRPSEANPRGAGAAGLGHATPRIKRIEVDGGRVNFKRGDEKLPFAFVEVSGSVEQNAPGQWQVNLDASPRRAAVLLQQTGTLHVEGQLGGTTSHLRPADLHFAWNDAALADALRLGTGTDHGIRGAFSAKLDAHTQGALWSLQGNAELRQVHRWDLSLRADNPALNVKLRADWLPESPELTFTELDIEAPRSSLRGGGVISWETRADQADRVLNLRSDGVQMADLLAWMRAFRPGVSEALTGHGSVRFDVALGGWPPRWIAGGGSIEDATIEGGSLRTPLAVNHALMRIDGRSARLLPATIGLGGGDGALRVEGEISAAHPKDFLWKLSGKTTNVADLADAAGAIGWNLPAGWKVEGPAAFDLQSANGDASNGLHASGKIDLQGLTLHAQFLNRPISQVRGRLDFAHGSSELTLASAQAFGGEWKGTMDVYPAGGERHFALSVDRLNAEDLDRWLNPRWRQGFLDNLLPFLSSASNVPAATENLVARGRISVDEFAFLRYVATHLKGDLAVEGRRLEFSNAEADFYGAHVSGKFTGDVEKSPKYAIRAHFGGLNIASLTAGSPTLARNFGGTADGYLELRLGGAGREALFASLECDGTAEIQNATVEGFDLLGSLRGQKRAAGSTSFGHAAGAYKCGNNRIEISELRLRGTEGELRLSGTVDSTKNIDLRVSKFSAANAGDSDDESGDDPVNFEITGPLQAPRFSRVETTPKER
jgi:AsmA-like C-terminal region